ncbi:MAG TPA: histidinol-phosphate transaminase [Bryobacteraceae bacterium]|nr:histidinol-phosphate transaminase [Bryobacteraceae bacterium]
MPWRSVLSASKIASPPKPREAVLRMDSYHPPTGGRRNKLRLDFNENTVGAPPHVIDFIKRYLSSADLSLYPEYDNALEDLALHFDVGPDELTLTNGTDEAIHLLLSTYVDPADEVIVLQPSYAMYRFYAQLAGAKVIELAYTPDTFTFPLTELLDRLSPATRAVLIANPNNPTGTGTDVGGLREILSRAPHAAVLVDEAYYEFSGITMLPHIADYANLFVCRTFSKTYGMAAMRCGVLFAHAENMAHVRKTQSPYSVNALAAMAARIAVQESAFVEEYVLEVLTARELLYVGLEKLRIPYIESMANFVLMLVGQRSIEIRDKLRECGVLVRDRSYEIQGAVRVTVGTRDQTQRFLDELEKLW